MKVAKNEIAEDKYMGLPYGAAVSGSQYVKPWAI
jgi:hypothetical protein